MEKRNVSLQICAHLPLFYLRSSLRAPCSADHMPLADSGAPATTGFLFRFTTFRPLDSSSSITFSATPREERFRSEMTFSRSLSVEVRRKEGNEHDEIE